MDFRHIFSHLVASIILFIRYIFQLIFRPYVTMRSAALRPATVPSAWILFISSCFFPISASIRPQQYVFIVPLAFFYIGNIFFIGCIYVSARFLRGNKNLGSYGAVYISSVIPTIVWFYCNLLLFIILPPPRTTGFLGILLSILFISFSISLAVWKVMLLYLAIRFSSRLDFYRVFFIILIYLFLAFPYAVVMYYWGIFRIPFI